MIQRVERRLKDSPASLWSQGRSQQRAQELGSKHEETEINDFYLESYKSGGRDCLSIYFIENHLIDGLRWLWILGSGHFPREDGLSFGLL